ncbi:hypothetical protein [Aquimarina algiphila]|uniref:hypothetical protein n=1 Tax=Aquimarina algiphila TaxID=2047982 RepID=UPI002330A5CD|nr:hypothetical protein [Aquimarina algiphila]
MSTLSYLNLSGFDGTGHRRAIAGGKQGKNKMSTINIIRNKLIARVFAVVKRQTPYVDILQYTT